MEYMSFDLRLRDWNPQTRTGEAEVLSSPAGESSHYRFLLNLDISATARRTHRSPSEAIDLGRELFESLFTEASLLLWRESYQIARGRNHGLRLRLQIDSWDLTRVPWELFYDPRRGEFLVFDPQVSLVRYLRMGNSPPVLRPAGTLKIMAVVASPCEMAHLDCDCEIAMLRDALHELIEARLVELVVCAHATHETLHHALLDHRPDVVHFIGHGEYDGGERTGYLLLEDERGLSHRVTAAEIARILHRYGTNLVVLNACETAAGAWAGLAPALVRAQVAAVVAMQWSVEDRAAIRFSRSFYKALAQGKSVDECLAEGRLGASATSNDPNDWTAPVLFLRSLSGQLWMHDVRRVPHQRGALPQPLAPTFRGGAPMPEHDALFKTRGPLQPIVDGDLIIDRPCLQRALRIASQPSVTQYVAILSARQTGKTTLLLRLKELLQDYYACIFVDLSVLSAQDPGACFGYVAFRLLSELRELLGDGLPMLETHQVDSSVGFLEFLRELADMVATPRIILLVDEVGALSPEVSNIFFNTLRTVFTEGRGLTNRLAKYLLVFSGAVDLYTLTSGNNSPLNICEKLYLNDFSLDDVRHIATQFARLDIKVGDGVAERLHHHAAGHPYLTSRLCALMERQRPDTLTVQHVDEAAEALLIEDDNIRHVIHELERRPAERRRLRAIVMEGMQTLFSRNDPVLASLEMIGAIRPLQPIAVRNRLYEHALHSYFSRPEAEEDARVTDTQTPSTSDPDVAFARLCMLRAQALGREGRYRPDKDWEAFAAALWATVPAFSLYPTAPGQSERPDLMLTIKPHRDGFWDTYRPAILTTFAHLPDVEAESFMAGLVARAERRGAKLLFLLATGVGEMAPERVEACYGPVGGTTVVLLDDEELGRLLADQRDLDRWLRDKTLEARLGGR
jgi:hypothetical protein